jgi:hypothetical protein
MSSHLDQNISPVISPVITSKALDKKKLKFNSSAARRSPAARQQQRSENN